MADFNLKFNDELERLAKRVTAFLPVRIHLEVMRIMLPPKGAV